jgi:hypothetical protein
MTQENLSTGELDFDRSLQQFQTHMPGQLQQPFQHGGYHPYQYGGYHGYHPHYHGFGHHVIYPQHR